MFQDYGVIFDVDGVLVDTGPFHFESWLKMANEIGKKFTKKFFDITFGQQSVPITRKLVGPKVEQHLVEKWAGLKEQYYREIVRDKLEPLPGVLNLVKDLKNKNFKLAIGSSGPPENVELVIKTLNLTQDFDAIITAAEVKRSKPEPDVFLIAAEKLKLDPKNCIVIEDAPVGIEAAKRAGMPVIALRTTHCNVDLLDADLIVSDLNSVNINDIIQLLNIQLE
ncbi:MAG: HAD family hydrolase [Candidatus Hodarchaeota archaeon]